MNQLGIKSELYTFETDDNLYFVATILVDGEPLVNFHNHATSLSELTRTLHADGEYFILTCWCGCPGCTGIEEGLHVVHRPGTIIWEIYQPRPRRTFTFDAREYQRAIKEGIEELRRDVASLWFTASGDKDEKFQLVPGFEEEHEDVAMLEPEPWMKYQHPNAFLKRGAL